MKLIADNSLSGGNPTIPVRWCLEPSDVEKLKEAGAKGVHILLLVAYENGREDRRFLPLEQTLTYITFRWPGKHHVFARLFWPGESFSESLVELRKLFLTKSRRDNYEYNILDYEKPQIRIDRFEFSFLFSRQLEGLAGAEFDVVVPREYFAKEPPAWLKWWANLFYEYPPVDQCQLRRRTILAFTIQPPLVLLWLITRTAIGLLYVVWLLLWGLRGIRFSPLLHPFNMNLGDLYERQGGGYCHRHCFWFRHDSKHNRKSLLWLFLHPLMILSGWGCLEALSQLFKTSYLTLLVAAARWVWHVVIFLVHSATILKIVLVVAGILAFACVFSYFLIPLLSRYLEETRPARKERKRQREQVLEQKKRAQKELLVQKRRAREELIEKQEKEAIEVLYNEMQCSTIPWIPSVKALPPKRRTLYLKFCDLKAKVCRPFAG